MAFSGTIFMFNNVSSDRFGLVLASIDGIPKESPLIIENEFAFQKASQSSKFYHIGTSQNSQLSFPLEFYSETYIDVYKREQIALWLSGNGKLQKLRILQDDMNSVYFNCYFKQLDWINVASIGYGFKGTVVCDAPYAWRNPLMISKRNQPTGGSAGNYYYPELTKVHLYNPSTNYESVIPSIKFKLGDNNNSVKIYNTSNQNNGFEFTRLQNGEEISISENLIIRSITNPNKIIIDNFTGDFLELINGHNDIVIDGQIENIEIKYQPSKLIGG